LNNESVTITLISQKTSESFNCTNKQNLGNGIYNCTFNTSLNPGIMPAKGYNVTIYSNKTYHNPDNETIEFIQGQSNAFWIETEPILTLPAPSYNTSDPTDPYGWGETWTFYINLTNEDHDQVDLYLWMRSNYTGTWSNWSLYTIGTGDDPTVADVTDENSIQSYTLTESAEKFTIGKRGYWEFKWNATEDDAGLIDNTTNVSYQVKDDNIEIIHIEGNNSVINRSIAPSQSNATFSVRINDTDKGSIIQTGGGTAYFNVTSNEDTYILSESQYTWTLETTKTIDNTYFNITFPQASTKCNYRIGPQRWKVRYMHDGYYENESVLYNVNLTTTPLDVEIVLPTTNTTIRKYIDSIFIQGNVSDDCASTNGSLWNVSVQFRVQEPTVPIDHVCTPILNQSNYYYNCTVSSSTPVSEGWDYVYHNVTMQANKSYYNSSPVKAKQDAIVLVSSPEINDTDIFTTPLEDTYTDYLPSPAEPWGWGEEWTLRVKVKDEDHGSSQYSDEVNVTVYINDSSLPTGWEYINSTTATGLSTEQWVTVTYHNFNSTHIGDHLFLFNITDTFNYTNQTNVSQSVEKDTVYIHWEDAYDPASVNREGDSTGTFKLRVRDLDNSTWVGNNVNVSFWFTENHTLITYDTGYDNQTDSQGYAQHDFNSTCDYSAGLQYWRGGVQNDQAYSDRNFTDTGGSEIDYTFYVYGQLKNYMIVPNWTYGQPIFNVTEQVNITYNITSECINWAAENPVVSATTNITIHAPNGSLDGVFYPNESLGIYNYTWNSTGKDEGNWSMYINSSKQYFNLNNTYLQDWFWLENILPQNQTDPQVTPTLDGWSRWYNYTIQVSDPENDTTNCTLWISTDNQNNWTNKGTYTLQEGNGTCYITTYFNTSDVNFTQTPVDNDNYFYFTLTDVENSTNTSTIQGPTLEPANITITHIQGNNSAVNITPDLSQYSTFILNITDTDNNTSPIPMNITIWVRLNDTEWDWSNVSQTNSSGYLNYNFTPNCSYEPGVREWYANSTDIYYDNETITNLNVTLNATITNNLLYPTGQEFLRDSNITLQVKINDTCGNNITDLNNESVTITLISQKTSESFNCTNKQNLGNGIYNCTFNTSLNPGIMPA
ncbi:MAG: hypothetical protein JSW41_05050, partial [Candidatus Aenigmatarchaeota archaeon]